MFDSARNAQMSRKAQEMALSGRYHDCLDLQLELRRNGYPEAKHLFRNMDIRLKFDAMCHDAKFSRPN